MIQKIQITEKKDEHGVTASYARNISTNTQIINW